MNQEALEKITKAKTRLIAYHPFYAFIALSTPMVEDNSPGMRMATDMEYIYYSVEFVLENSINEIAGTICHEVLHIAYMHGLRKGTRIHDLWNVACDFAINPIVHDSKGLSLPTDVLYDAKYRDWSADKIYDDLKQSDKVIPVPTWGGFSSPKGGRKLTDSEKSELEGAIKIKVSQAANAAKARGLLPAKLSGLIEAVGQPKIDWKDYIQQWVSGVTPDNYTWQRPNRTFMAVHSVYMPRMQMNGAGKGLLSIDTSGSVSDDELRLQVTEITGVIELCSPDKLTIVQHDAKVHGITTWEAGDEFNNLKITGRGGTLIRPVFKAIAELDEAPDWIIIFSDGEIMDWPPAHEWPNVPTLLAFTGPDTSPKNVEATYIPLKSGMETV